MRRCGLFVAFVVLLAVTYSRTMESQTGAVRQLAPGVYSRQGDKDAQQPANTSWVEFRDFVVVIEANTPWGIKATLPEIRKTTSKPIRYAFDTHYHWDQSGFIDDLWRQVSAGKKVGKTADQLVKEIDLSKHGDFAADAQQNQAAIRQVFRKAPG